MYMYDVVNYVYLHVHRYYCACTCTVHVHVHFHISKLHVCAVCVVDIQWYKESVSF